MEPFAPEYTPELSKSYLDSQLYDIGQRGREDEGRAISEMAARGTLGTETADSAVGAVRAGVRRDSSKTIGDFNLNVADRRREERLGEKARTWGVEDRDFGAAEAAKTRDFQTRLAVLGYNNSSYMQNRAERGQMEGAIMGGIFGIGSSAVGGYMGNVGGKNEKRVG